MVRALVIFAVWAAIGLVAPVGAGAAAWNGLPPVSVARYGIGAAVSGGKLYAFGGLDGNDAQSVSEVYDPVSGSWSLIRPMPVVGWDVHAATGSGGRIYVLSGGGTLTETYFWVYTPWTNRWRTLAKPPRMHTDGSLVLGGDGRLYAVGGNRGNVQYPVRAVDAYSPATRRWSRVAPLPVRRDLTGGATAPDGSVIVFGGGCMPCREAATA